MNSGTNLLQVFCQGIKSIISPQKILLLYVAVMLGYSTNLTAQEPPEALFLVPEQICAPATVTLVNKSYNATDYRWYVDNIYQGDDVDLDWEFINDSGSPYTDVEVTIRLEASNDSGEPDDVFEKTVIVFHEVNASFTSAPDQGCHPLEVSFTNTSGGHTGSWEWNFGDGGSSGQMNPGHTYTNFFSPNDEVYTVTLEATSPNGCKSVADDQITVIPYTHALFTVDTLAGCGTLDVSINNMSALFADEYRWVITDESGNEDIYSYNDPSLTPDTEFINNTGSTKEYTISLTTIRDGCTDEMAETVTVYPAVSAAFLAVPDEGCSELSVEFQNTSGNATYYLWDFGDGGSSSLSDPVHTYEKNLTDADQIWEVALIAWANVMCRDTTEPFPITVKPHVEADFAVDVAQGCHPLEVNITNNSLRAVDYLWEFFDQNGDPLTDVNGVPIILTSEDTGPQTFLNNGFASPVEYTIRLTASRDDCIDEMERTVTVYPDVSATFGLEAGYNQEGCSPLTIEFENSSQGSSLTYLWEFGDGGTSSEQDPVHTWEKNLDNTEKIYDVILTATSEHNCKAVSVPVEIRVYPYIEAGFTIDRAEGCHPLLVSVTDISVGAESYLWQVFHENGDPLLDEFGDPVTSSDEVPGPFELPNNSSPDPVDYIIRLGIENSYNCSDYFEHTVTVHPELISAFTADTDEDCGPLAVQFTNESENADYYLWEFGDGATSTEEHPPHTFHNPGTTDQIFTVRLTSFSAGGECTEVSETDILIHGKVEAGFSFAGGTGCNPGEVIFENSSIGDGLEYTWDFGDGSGPLSTSSSAPVAHTFTNTSYSETAEYVVNLTAENYAGCTDNISRIVSIYPDISAHFDVTSEDGCHPLTVGFTNNSDGGYYYHWDFGDGNTSSEEEPVHTFANTGSADSTYRVKMVTTAVNNVCTDSFFMDITVFPVVLSEFSFANSPSCTPFEILFENSSVNASEYHWDFGNGNDTITYNRNPFVYTFRNSGFSEIAEYQVIMTAVSDRACDDESSQTVRVYPDIEARFEADISEGCNPLTVDFTSLSSGAANYQWDFGDGGSSSDENPVHTFFNTGPADKIYSVKMVASAGNNVCRDTFHMDIRVHGYVKADFTFPEGIFCTPAEFEFINSSTGGQTYRWDFGNGEDTVTWNMDAFSRTFANNSYTDEAAYRVALEVENYAGCTDLIERTVRVHPDIRAYVVPSVTEGCHPLEVEFDNRSPGIYTSSWNFGEGTTTDRESPVHTFTNFTNSSITREVTLQVTSENFCTSDTTFTVTVHPLPKPFIDIDESVSCPPFNLSVGNNTQGAISYRWDFGDGSFYDTGSKEPFIHTWDNDRPDIADHDLKLIAETQHGCIDSAQQKIFVYPGVITNFSSITEGCSPLTVRFVDESIRAAEHHWNLGDGSFSKLKDPTHLYFNNSVNDTIFYVRQVGISEYGCTDTMGYNIEVFPQPVSEFTAQPTHQVYPSTRVELENLTNDGYWDFVWDFDDGNTSYEKDPDFHEFGDWGEYDISLHVSSENCSHLMSHTVRILPSPPIADFDQPESGCAPLGIQFRNNSVYGHTYLWEFGDGHTSSEPEPYHVFESAGVYNVKLTVTGFGGTEFAYRDIEVFRLPEVDFKVSPGLVMLPEQPVQLYNLSIHGHTYSWNFGDHNGSGEESPRHLYQATGEYDITLQVWTEHNCYGEMIKHGAVRVTGEGIIKFPNAFRPDPSGPSGGYYDRDAINPNTVFYPLNAGVEEYRLDIYNRWGEHLFTSTDIEIGWDGYYQGKIAKQDVYVWKVQGTFINGKPFLDAGNVTLLR